jgi:hypothetical protein
LLSRLAGRAIEDDVRTKASGSVATVLGVVAALYAVLVAFVIVNEWQTFDTVSDHVSHEAAALAATYYSAGTLPAVARADVQGRVLAYDRSVVCDELPRLGSDGRGSPRTRDALQALFAAVERTHARDPHSPFHDVMAAQVAQVAGFRRDRIDSVGNAVPDLMLVVLIVTSVVTIAIASVLDTQHRRWHVVLTGAVTLVVALNLTLILALDQPYRGAAQVSDAPLRDGIPAAVLRCTGPTTPGATGT